MDTDYDRLTEDELNVLEHQLSFGDNISTGTVFQTYGWSLIRAARAEIYLRSVIERMISCARCTQTYLDLDKPKTDVQLRPIPPTEF